MNDNVREGTSLNETRRNWQRIVLHFDAFCEGKSNYTYAKTIVNYVAAEGGSFLRRNRLRSTVTSLRGEAVDIESFLPILQRTMKTLTMPGRLGTILMADRKFCNWADKTSKRQVI